MLRGKIEGLHIARIKINGDWISDELELRKGISDAFQACLSNDMAWRVDIEELPFPL